MTKREKWYCKNCDETYYPDPENPDKHQGHETKSLQEWAEITEREAKNAEREEKKKESIKRMKKPVQPTEPLPEIPTDDKGRKIVIDLVKNPRFWEGVKAAQAEAGRDGEPFTLDQKADEGLRHALIQEHFDPSKYADVIEYALRIHDVMRYKLVPVLKDLVPDDGAPPISKFVDGMEKVFEFARIEGDKVLLMKRNYVFVPAESFVRKLIEDAYPNAMDRFKKEVIIKLGDRNPAKRGDFDKDPHVLTFLNGSYNIAEGKKVDNYKAMKQFNIIRDPGLGPSKLLEEVIAQWQPDKKDRERLLKVMATCFVRDSINFVQIFILQGAGSNGKTTCIDMIKAMLGEDNYSTVSLQDLEENRFAAANLEGCYMNIYDDLEETELKTMSKSKILTGKNSTIPAERKFVDSWKMSYKGQFLYSCNQFPALPNYQEAIIRRFVVFRFEEVFKDEANDVRLIDRLTTPEELSRILNTLTPYVKKIMKDGMVDFGQSGEEVKRLWEQHGNSALEFIADYIVHERGTNTLDKDVYKQYAQFCTTSDKAANSDRTLVHHLKKRGFVKFKTQFKNKRGMYWRDLAIKAPKEDRTAQISL